MLKISGPALMLLLLLLSADIHAAGIKTYYKQYSVFTYENENILCEPYQVQKNDWLYKIFRQKGEISDKDFPRFLNIFKEINPLIKNIDAIEPGLTILIPLKKIDRPTSEQSDQKTSRIIKVPVVEFSSIPDTFDIQPFIQKHTIQTGDTVSKLLGKEFLQKGGSLSQEAQTTFSHLNPEVKDIDRIYQGTQVVIPDPSILSQPWFESFLKHGGAGPKSIYQKPVEKASAPVLPVIPPLQMIRLQRYAALIQGILLNQGQMHFPGKGSPSDQVLDLSKTPVIEDKDGQKILIVPSDNIGNALGRDLVRNIQAYWKQLKILEINKAISMAKSLPEDKGSLADKANDPAGLIAKLLSFSQDPYRPDETISFSVGSVEMSASFGRITRQDALPDLLINTGKVYGLAIEAIEKKGYHILTISPGLTLSELILTLFTRLGYSTWKNPSFNTLGQVEIISGIYVTKEKKKLFFTRQRPTDTAISFLEQENIQFLILDTP
ncbi:MAG: hypothetical protein KKF12_11245 [Proteobacteria bacterium]|nr:hypothetical protein [Pseudomonadota bacterium]MBU4131385.1 hypothetical protein [Pseudomonadota bacterium]